MVRIWVLTALISFGTLLTGCASSAGPEVITIAPEQYEAAFDAAMDAVRAEGMEPTLRDRRSGVIETGPAIAGSVFEPWSGDNASVAQAWDNTLAMHRRRARFEFAPVGFRPPAEADSAAEIGSEGLLTGPELLNDDPVVDLTRSGADLEVRVWVFVERSHTVGMRRNTWSRRQTRQSHEEPPNPEWEERPHTFWEPIARDEAAERRLLAEVVTAMALESAAEAATEGETAELQSDEAASTGTTPPGPPSRSAGSGATPPDRAGRTTSSTS